MKRLRLFSVLRDNLCGKPKLSFREKLEKKIIKLPSAQLA